MSDYDKVVQAQNDVVATAQARIIAILLPDTCTLKPAIDTASRTVSRYGVTSSNTPSLRTYNGSTDIPCRADAQRAFRPEHLDYQVSQVDELDLHLPIDVTIEEEDIVTLRGHQYKIRKLANDSAWDLTVVAKIMRITTELDND